MRRFCFVLLLLPLLSQAYAQQGLNKFSDPVIREIHDLADQRDVDGLLPYLRDTNLNYRGEALMCFGSVQAIGIADSIAEAMDSEIDGIRIAGAFALGQTYHETAAVQIRQLIDTEEKPLVRGMLYDALGKCGTAKDLEWLAEQNLKLQQTEGQAMGIFRFALRGIISDSGNDRMLVLCAGGSSVAGLTYASYYLGRYAPREWLQANAVLIRQTLDNERNSSIRSHLIKAVIKAEDEEAWVLVEHILKSDEDYRVKVNILNSLQLIPWNKVSKLVYEFATGNDPGLAVAAAEAIHKHAVYTDLSVHLKAIDRAVNWRSRAVLLDKGLELVQGKKGLSKKLEKKVLDYYAKARHDTERSWLLKALKYNILQYKMLAKEISSDKAPVLSTNALETLVSMRKGKNFEKAKADLEMDGIDLEAEFMEIFIQAVGSGDVPLISLAAGVLRDPELNYKELITDLEFLKTALINSQKPEQVEARNELVYTLAYFMDKQIPAMSPPTFNHPIDWDRISKIHPRQQIGFVTSKGEILVQLNINWCPGTVGAFIELIERGYFNGKSIHRVVPNFVVQDGCPRGDGWGGPEFTIRSEFNPAPFVEGTLGMASAGKDTEGSQWYFTHSATPHLDAKYTNFGYVIEGMDVVHQLEVGDVIERVELVEMDN